MKKLLALVLVLTGMAQGCSTKLSQEEMEVGFRVVYTQELKDRTFEIVKSPHGVLCHGVMRMRDTGAMVELERSVSCPPDDEN